MPSSVRILLCGDVMPARGVDQVLPHPGDPTLWEPAMTDARDYVALAEARNGPIPRPMPPAGPWGDALAEIERAHADAVVVNLETSITARGYPLPKGINYRMHPANIDFLTAAHVDICSLANNHVLDFGPVGLVDTVDTVKGAGIRVCGAGTSLEAAREPAVVELEGGGRLLVYALGATDSGVPPEWAAGDRRPGVWHLDDYTHREADLVAARIAGMRGPRDLAVVSIHWGSNWGYAVPPEHVRFAHRLVDGGVDLVCGHSSHHPRPFEVYRDRLVLYGCGDFLNDYEGIHGYEAYRPDLALLYAVTLRRPTGELEHLEMTPFQLRGLTLRRASRDDARWLAERLSRAGAGFDTKVACDEQGRLLLAAG